MFSGWVSILFSLVPGAFSETPIAPTIPPSLAEIGQALARYERTPRPSRSAAELARLSDSLQNLLDQQSDEDGQREVYRLLTHVHDWQGNQASCNQAWQEYVKLLGKRSETERVTALKSETKEALIMGRTSSALAACSALAEATSNKTVHRFAAFHEAMCHLWNNDPKTACKMWNELAQAEDKDEWTMRSHFQIALYNTRRRNTSIAIKGWNDFMEEYSDSPLIPAARHFQAVNLYQSGYRYRALRSLQDLITKYPKGAYVEPSKLLIQKIKQDLLQRTDPFD
mgnify:FL=1|tara:strand:+ start:204 stop:1052 length:849 start_codon:yes stop_codon:yes gene_type:complete